MYETASVLWTLYALAAAIPNPTVTAQSTLDVNNPSGSDPTSPPSTISFPSDVAENPYPDGIPTQPDICDGQNPSEDCFNAMGSGGYLWFDKDSQCSDEQKGQLETAIWDATTLASYSSNFPNNGKNTRDQAIGIFYMGPDYASQQSRIAGNLKRVSQFKTSLTSSRAYITTSCKDTKNWCNLKYPGQAVGGYGWTYNRWWAYYHYITLCPPFFGLDSLNDKLDEIEENLASGNGTKAGDMRYLRSTGQYFLHEMMHTRIADGGVEPHIIDEYVAPIPAGEKRGTNDFKAYGPGPVHNLARRNIRQGGGATRASTNADSYALLANAVWWWDTTEYFPGVPKRPAPGATSADGSDPELPLFLHIDFDNSTDPTTADFNSLFNDDLQSFANGLSDLDDPSASITPSTATASSIAPTLAPTPKLTCNGVGTTKWMGRDALNNVIPTFCEDAEKQGVQDKDSGSLVRSYNKGGDAVTLSMDWPSGANFKPQKDDCVGFLITVMDSCDGNDPIHNPLNWKHGGYNQVGDVRYNIIPTAQRYNAGTCSMHVHQEEYFYGDDGLGTSRTHKYYLRVKAKDSAGKIVATVDNDVEAGDADPYHLSGYYNDLKMTPEARGEYIQFALGDQWWTSTHEDGVPRCKVGGWDSDKSPIGRDMDCWFYC